jgi:uncharacterized protein with GYD domain
MMLMIPIPPEKASYSEYRHTLALFLIKENVMSVFVMLTRLSPELLRTPQTMEELEHQAMERIRTTCPDVVWLHSYAVLGPYDYLDIFTAPDMETATRVSVLIRTYGRAHSEIWPVTEWARFKEILRGLPGQ